MTDQLAELRAMLLSKRARVLLDELERQLAAAQAVVEDIECLLAPDPCLPHKTELGLKVQERLGHMERQLTAAQAENSKLRKRANEADDRVRCWIGYMDTTYKTKDASQTIEVLRERLAACDAAAPRLDLELPEPESQYAKTSRAVKLLGRWREWARAHGHLEHAEGISRDTDAFLSKEGGAR
jgi:hypothetical protein